MLPGRPRLALALALLTIGCSREPQRTKVVVLAAASLTESFTAIERELEQQRPDLDVELSFAGSQLLASQLLEGARAEVFASANPEQLDRVANGRGVVGRRAFAGNRLVVIVPAGSSITSVDALAGAGVRVVLAGEKVPAGKYARAALDQLGLREQVEANVVSNENDVRGVVAKVALGEADAGIVYATDLRGSEAELVAVELPKPVDVSARYELAVLADASAKAGGEAFVELVTGEVGQRILSEHGFTPVATSEGR